MISMRLRLETATISDILYLFGRGKFILPGKYNTIAKTDVCGNHGVNF